MQKVNIMIPTNRLTTTPVSLGYRWPAEWEPHAATWLSWPHKRRTWPGKFDAIPPLFAEFVRTLAQFEPVHVLAGGDALRDARTRVAGIAGVTIHDVSTNDAWCRDHGPTFLASPPGMPAALVDWEFNSWGGKHPPFELDNQVPTEIARIQNRVIFRPGIVLEGGAIEGNGNGTILTTEQCLLNPNRNPHLSRGQIEEFLFDYLGAVKVLWLTGGELAGDDTDGHIDQLARFVNPRTVLVATTDDRTDENFAPLRSNLLQLQKMTNSANEALEVIPLPLPGRIYHDEQRLPTSYCNFHIANGAVLVPQFDDPQDANAVRILRHCFPDRQIIGLPARDLIWGLGAYHCLSQQEPVSQQGPMT